MHTSKPISFRVACCCAALVSILFAHLAPAATHHVHNADEFNALPTLHAGDVVILHSGSYGALVKTLNSSIADDATAQANPIHVTAATPGGVKVTAPSRITLNGRGIVFAGVDFVAGSGMLDNGVTTPAWIIRATINSRHITISNVRFLNCTEGDLYGNWILLNGFNHTVEYCSFEGQDEPVAGAVLSIVRSTAEAGIDVTRNHVIRYNYFGPRECSVSENGYETIRIGESGSQAYDMGVLVEHNVFYRSIWRNDGVRANEPEIISNKTRGNHYRYNTFLESQGHLTLRHGDHCIVEGNFVFGGGYYDGGTIALSPAANTAQSGVRVTGEHHIVRNNYFVNLRGTGERAAVAVLAGYPDFNDGNGSGGDATYEAAHHLQFYNNTFVDCREWRFGARSRVESSLQPVGVTVFNNAWQGNSASTGLAADPEFLPGSSGGNHVYHPAGAFGWTGLAGTYSSTASPDISEPFEHYLIPTSSSPLLDQASGVLSVTDDIRGALRPASGRDIGAFEREAGGGVNRPLLRHEVGPVFDGGPSGTFPQPPGFPLTVLTTSLRSARIGTVHEQTLEAFGGTPPLTWSLASGTLPDGLTLEAGGAITGVATTLGEASLEVRVTDAASTSVVQPLTLSVVTNSIPAIVTTVLASGEAGTPYEETIEASGGDGPLLWFVVSGTLPPGLVLEQTFSATARLTGTPAVSGTYEFTLHVDDEDGDFATRTFSVFIASFAPTVPVITVQPVAQHVAEGASVTFSVSAAGAGPLSYQWRKNGIDLSGQTAASLSYAGVAASDAGSYSVRVSNPNGFAISDAVALTVTTAGQDLFLADAFADGERFTQDLPVSARWLGNNASVLGVTGDALTIAANGSALAYFTNGAPRTLAVGESLQSTFNLVFEGASLPAGNDLLRIALLNSHGTPTDHNGAATANRIAADGYSSATLAFRNNSGYMAGVALAPSSANGLRFFARHYEATNTLMGTASYSTLGPLGGSGGFGFVPGDAYACTFTVRRATATTTVLTLSFAGTFANGTTGTWSHVLTDGTGHATHTFDAIAFFIGPGAGITGCRVENVRIGAGVPATTPAFTQHPQSQTAGLGANVIFTAAASGDPAPTFQWRKDDVDIPGATGTSLALTDVSLADAGAYTVVATNAAGPVTSNAAMLVVYDPTDPALVFGGTTLVAANQNMRGLSAGAVAFSDTEPIHPLTGYTGQAFYGGVFVSGGAVIDQWNVFNDNVAGDSLRFRMAASPVNAKSVGVFVWKRADFASPYDAGLAVNLSTPDAALSYTGRRFGSGVGSHLRFVVQAGDGGYYVSASLGEVPATFATVTLTNPQGAAQWFEYLPASDTIGATPAAPDFSSILAAGVRMEVVKTGADGGAITVALSGFRVTGGSSIPAVTGPTNGFGLVGQPFSFTVGATNAPTSFSFGALPDGFTADATTGIVSGTPLAAGSHAVTVRPANASGAGPATTLTLSFAMPSQAAIPTTGLVANFEFSGNANDLAANRGGVVVGATLTADRFGQADSAYVFDGLTQYIEVADDDDFSVSTTGELSFSVWMRPDALTFPRQQGSGYVHWIGKGEAGQHEWVFRMYGLGNSEGRENRTSFYLFNAAGGEGAGSYVQQPVAVGEWIHYVAVVSTSADTITWYKNGVQVDRDPFHDSIYNVTPTNGSAPLRIGTRDLGSYFQGAIDDLRIYNRVLTVAEVQQLHGDSLGANRAPTAVALSNQTLALAGATAGASIGVLTTTDPDPADAHVYSLPGTGGDTFAIVGETLAVGSAALGAGTHQVVVRTTDAGGLFFEQEFSITVEQASPTLTWSPPDAIVYGTPLSALQLNATATGINGEILAGEFAYTPAAGALLGAGVDQPLSVVFIPTGPDAMNYHEGSGATTITVMKAVPAIGWPAPAAITYGTPLSATQFNAIATGVGGESVAGLFDYAPPGGTVLAAGENQVLSVTFTPTGASALNYLGATGATTITVDQAATSIELGNLHQLYDGTPRPVTVATTPADQPVVITYDGDPTPPTYPGSYAVEAIIQSANHTGSASGTLVITTTARVRQAPSLNGGLDGSLQVLLPGNITLNGNAWVSGDLLVPGTPILQVNGQPLNAGVLEGPGSAAPAHHRVTLNGGSVLRYLVRRIDAPSLAPVAAPPSPAGTRNVVLNNPGQSAGDFATLRNLTLNASAGQVPVPPGTYGALTANGNSGFTLGVPGATEPAVYHLQNLTLNGGGALRVAGPVIVTLANGVSLNGSAGAEGHPEWFTLFVASGGVTLNGNATLHGHVVAPAGAVVINGGAELVGSVAADRLTINGSGRLSDPGL